MMTCKIKQVKWEPIAKYVNAVEGPDEYYAGTIEGNNDFELSIERYHKLYIAAICSPDDYFVLSQESFSDLDSAKEHVQEYINNHVNSFLEITYTKD